MDEYVSVTATVVDRWGQSESVWVGTQPEWAWQVDRCEAWRKVMRRMLLAERTTDPTGWRVTFDAVPEVECNA